MNFAGISQGILNYQQQQRDQQVTDQEMASKRQLMAAQQFNMEQARSNQAGQLRAQQAIGNMASQPPPQPPMPGQSSQPMQPPPMAQQQQQPPMQPPSSTGMPNMPLTDRVAGGGIPPYQTVDGMAKQRQAQPMGGAPSGPMPPPSINPPQTQGDTAGGPPPQVQQMVQQSILQDSLADLKKQGFSQQEIGQIFSSPDYQQVLKYKYQDKVDEITAKKEANQAAEMAYKNRMNEQKEKWYEENIKSEIQARAEREKQGQQRINISLNGGGGGGDDLSHGRAAAYEAGQSLGQGKNQKAMAIASIKKAHPEWSDLEIAQKGEMAVELNKARTQQLVMQGKVSGFEKTTLSNLDQIEKEIEAQRKSGKTDIPAMNSLLNKWKIQSGQAYGEGVRLFGQESAAELAKLASSATAAGAGGTLTDREEWKKFFDEHGSYAQMKKSLDSARTAVRIRVKSGKDAINDTTGQLNELWGKSGGSPEKSGSKEVHWDDLK